MDQLTLGAVAEIIGAKLEGDSNHLVSGLATLASALPHQVSFLANMKYAHIRAKQERLFCMPIKLSCFLDTASF